MSKKLSIGFTVLVVIVLGYWFIYRPYSVRKTCFAEALDSAVLSTQSYYPLDNIKRQDKQDELINNLYQSCVRSKGLRN
jgi:hypothetical protein